MAKLFSALILTLGLLPAASAAGKAKGKGALVPYATFKTWKPAKQKEYMRSVRDAWTAFEKISNKDLQFADGRSFTWPQFLPQAVANDGGFCIVGGIERGLVQGNGKWVCPTSGHEGQCGKGKFECGSVYNKVCVPRDANITDNCEAKSRDQIPNESLYNEKSEDFEEVRQACGSGRIDSRYSGNCEKFIARLDEIKKKYASPPLSSPPPAVAAAIPAPQAKVEAEVEAEAAVEPQAIAEAPEEELIGKVPDSTLPPTAPDEAPIPAPREAMPEAPLPPIAPEENIPLPEARPKQKPKQDQAASGGGCQNKYPELGRLSCLACSLKAATGHDASNWISLLGVMAQSVTQGAYGRGNNGTHQQHVAEMIAAFGYCTNSEYPISNKDLAQKIIAGEASVGRNSKKFVSGYGLGPTGIVRNNMFFADKIFNDSGWSRMNVQQRQWRFRNMGHAFATRFPNSKFAGCFRAAEARMKSKRFNFCDGKRRTLSGSAVGHNQSLYKALANSCGFKPRKFQTSTACNYHCEIVSGISTSRKAIYPTCDHKHPRSPKPDPLDKPGESDGGRKPPGNPGKPGERDGNRGGGGNHGGGGGGGNHGGGGGGGKNGGSEAGNGGGGRGAGAGANR